MIKDKVLFGSLIGVLANMAMDILQFPLWKLKIVKHPLAHYAGSLFLDINTLHHTFLGSVVSFMTDYIYGALWGCVFVYFLEYTGKRFFIWKGLIFGAFMWLFSFGWIRALTIVKLREVVPGQTLYYLLFHLVYGLALGVLVRKWGEEL